MKLYDLKRGSKFTLVEEPSIPPDALPGELGTGAIYKYTHVDGMYAPVTDTQGNRLYFAAWTEVNQIEDALL